VFPFSNERLLIEFRQSAFVVLERQYLIFIAAAGAGFAALLVVGLFFNPLQAEPNNQPTETGVIEAEVGKTAYVRYSSGVIRLVQNLPERNILRIEAPSELLNTNLAGLKGEFRYSAMTISYVQKGKQEEISETDFKTVQYRFLPDAGNVTSYTYRNVDFTAQATSAELIAAFVPLSTARAGEEYPVRIILEGGPADIAVDEKKIKVVS
jgi:hypothetical protein